MSKGNYNALRDALRAFESGWDRERYEEGIIQDWQLDQWAGGPVGDFFPGASSWGDLSDSEWDAMSYRSTNWLGFVGYQFGEALLIDLGYYDDDFYYLGGDTINRWDGTWTGKNGVNSLEDFMTKEKQEIAIQEAFGFNLQIIETQLGYQGLSLDDFIGETFTYTDVDGSTVSVELSITGIMAAAHLRGAYGTATLLLGGGASTDENGTSILRYIEEYGGYDAPTVDEAIAFYEDRKTGDEGLGIPGGDTGGGTSGTPDAGGGAPQDDPGTGTADATKATADVVITWSWGTDAVISDFDPATDTIFVDWIGADFLDVTETAAGVVFALPSNNQSTTLSGVTLADLSAANFTIQDTTAAAEILALVGGAPADTGDDPSDGTGDGGMTGGGGGGDGSGDHGGDHGSGHGSGHTHQHVTIDLATPGQIIDGFLPGMGDMIEIGADVMAEDFVIFEESGDALGQTVRIVITDGSVTKQIVFTGFGLADLTLANITSPNQGVQNEIAAALGAVIVTPGEGEGYTLSYDSDGSNPPATSGATDAGGIRYIADSNADDITGFDPARDALDFGGTSVHGMIVTKSEAGEIVIDSPWSDAAQIVQGVSYQDVSIGNFGTVGNEHFRQDMGAVVSWEQGIGPRDTDTVYIRSHEYGQHEVIDGFDPTSMKISFLFFGTRERLTVEDSAEGLVIASLPTGQSFTFTGVTKAELVPGLVEFHFDQVMEDNLETPFGFDQNDVTLVNRTMLLTPAAPAGATTDGFQTRTGDMTGSIYEGGDSDGGNQSGGSDGGQTGGGSGSIPGGGDVVAFVDGAGDNYTISWSYGSTTTITGFNPAEDTFDFGTLAEGQLGVSEEQGDLVFEVLGNGGDFVVIEGVQAEDLSAANLTAPDWNPILDPGSTLVAALTDLGYEMA
ncbi:MAG: hypothetical protein AAGC86_00090 [Pseudomonadota bacterium]